jgi:hypothetical protein
MQLSILLLNERVRGCVETKYLKACVKAAISKKKDAQGVKQ